MERGRRKNTHRKAVSEDRLHDEDCCLEDVGPEIELCKVGDGTTLCIALIDEPIKDAGEIDSEVLGA